MSTNSVFKMFARSPIGPLQQHMSKSYECAYTLIAFFEAVLEKNWDQAKTLQVQISELEHTADNLKTDLRIHLPKGLFMPVSRGDILLLLHYQDEVADKAKDIASLVVGRKMEIPDILSSKVKNLVKTAVETAEQANQAINELDELFEVGFRGQELKHVNKMIEKLNELEHKTDQLQIDVYQGLFQIENEMLPIPVMFLYKLIDWIGELANKSQQVGGRLQLLLAK